MCLALSYFSTLSHKRLYFRRGGGEGRGRAGEERGRRGRGRGEND